MILFNYFFCYCVAAGKGLKMASCNREELKLPDNAEMWKCDETGDIYVTAGAHCFLKCNSGFIATKCKYYV